MEIEKYMETKLVKNKKIRKQNPIKRKHTNLKIQRRSLNDTRD